MFNLKQARIKFWGQAAAFLPLIRVYSFYPNQMSRTQQDSWKRIFQDLRQGLEFEEIIFTKINIKTADREEIHAQEAALHWSKIKIHEMRIVKA